MSESDDKARSSPADSGSRSLFDSDWDALLGDAAAPSAPLAVPVPAAAAPVSAPTAPVPAPKTEPEVKLEPEPVASPEPGVEAEPEPEAEPKPEPGLREADSVPRNSTARASVSGAYLAPTPRPEPKTPPAFEPPPGVSPYYDDPDAPWGDPEAITGDYMVPVIEPSITAMASEIEAALERAAAERAAEAKPTTDDDAAAKVIELPTARPKPSAATGSPKSPEPVDPPDPAADEDGGGSRGTLLVIAALLAVAVIAYGVSKLSADDDAATVASKAEVGDPGSGSAEQDPKPPASKPEPPAPKPELGGTETGGVEVDETGGEEPGGDETGGWQPKPQPRPTADPRDPSLIPPGTPEDNAKAFAKLPVSIHDGPPVGGIGRTGIHIDAISTSRGRANTECDNPTANFSLSVAKYVNVCFRIVHPREPENVRVIWEKDGKVTRRGKVGIPELHAYTTRAYLFLRPEYIGRWRVRIVPEGEESIDLAVAEFEITE